MATTPTTGLVALSNRPQRRLLVALSRRIPRDDTPVHSDDLGFVDEELDNHLHHLGNMGFIDYDQEDQTVTRGPNFEDIEPLLQLINEHEDELPNDWL